MKAYTLYKGKTNELNVVPLNKQVRFAAPKIIHHDTCFESFDHNMKLVPWNADSPQVISGGPPPQSSPAVHPRRPPPPSTPAVPPRNPVLKRASCTARCHCVFEKRLVQQVQTCLARACGYTRKCVGCVGGRLTTG